MVSISMLTMSTSIWHYPRRSASSTSGRREAPIPSEQLAIPNPPCACCRREFDACTIRLPSEAGLKRTFIRPNWRLITRNGCSAFARTLALRCSYFCGRVLLCPEASWQCRSAARRCAIAGLGDSRGFAHLGSRIPSPQGRPRAASSSSCRRTPRPRSSVDSSSGLSRFLCSAQRQPARLEGLFRRS